MHAAASTAAAATAASTASALEATNQQEKRRQHHSPWTNNAVQDAHSSSLLVDQRCNFDSNRKAIQSPGNRIGCIYVAC